MPRRLYLAALFAVGVAGCPSFPEPVLREGGTEGGVVDVQSPVDVPVLDTPAVEAAVTDVVSDAPRDIASDTVDASDAASDAAPSDAAIEN